MTPEELEAVLAQIAEDAEHLSTLSADRLEELKAHLRSEANELRGSLSQSETPEEDVEQIEANVALISAIDGVLSASQEEDAARLARADAALANLSAEEEESTEEPEAEEPEAEESTEEVEEEEAVTASAADVKTLAARRRRRETGGSTEPRPENDRVAMFAMPGLNGIQEGTAFSDRLAVGEAMINKYEKVRPRPGAKAEYAQFTVARGRTEHRFNMSDSVEQNIKTLSEFRQSMDDGEDARVASGGVCSPAEVMYDFYNVATRAGTIQLPTMGMGRGRVQIPTSPSIQDVLGQTGIATTWTIANDENPSDPATKPCLTVTCPEFGTFNIEAHVTCRQYGNFQAKFYPESVANFDRLTMIAHDIEVDQDLIAAIEALATVYNPAGMGGGAFVELTNTLSFYRELYLNKYRMAPGSALNVYAPAWVRAAVIQDIINRNSTVDFGRAAAQVDAWFSQNSLRVQWLANYQAIDQSPGGWPTAADFLLEAPGTVVRADAGVIDLGVVRDSTLNSTNDYQNFVETFESIVQIGHEVMLINGVSICPTGNAAGYRVDELVCASS